jgi:CDP-4-dehydro-6-deoxyglucose reductase
MSRLLPLSLAARLVGVTRGALQKKVRDGELASFEGMVRPEDLLRAYPGTQLDDEAELARVESIKERAFGRRVYERSLPDKEVLAARLGELARELAELRTGLARHQALLGEIGTRLAALARDGNEAAGGLEAWLKRELEGEVADSEDASRMLAQECATRVITPHVKVVPGGQEFFVEGADTILEAALHAGLAMEYGCSSGNCGQCKARVVAGRVKRVRHHDYVLTEAEKTRGYALMCACTPVTDLVIEAAVARTPAEIPLQTVTAQVRKLGSLSDAMMLLELVTPRTSRLRFLAGQSATLCVGGTRTPLPIASCPCEERRLHFHVRRIPGNRFSDYVFGRLRIGESLTVEGPIGDFVLREESGRPVAFIAWGADAFAPVKSLIEHAIAQDAAETIRLYWIGASERDHYFPKLCRAWAEALDNFRYAPLVAGAGLHSEVDRAVRGALAQVVSELDDLAACHVYCAGEAPQVAAAEAMLREHGLPPGQFFGWTSH